LDALVRQELVQGLLDRAENTTILISSHDLAEIESFASHIGYLENGCLRFTEETAALSDRFRQVELTFDAAPSLPSNWPGTWIQPQTAPAVIRFVDSQFDRERTAAEIGRLFPDARTVAFSPMALTDIFVALAMTARQAAAA